MSPEKLSVLCYVRYISAIGGTLLQPFSRCFQQHGKLNLLTHPLIVPILATLFFKKVITLI